MISDEERRHVAKRLRGIELVSTYGGDMVYRDEVCVELGIAKDGEFCEPSDVMRIADLIDRPTTTRHGKFRTKYGRETPCCEVCGYSIGDMRWNHCPKCGAVIADD